MTLALEKLLTQYVLGELDDPRRLEVEERLITDPDTFEALGVVELELAESYIDDELPRSRKTAFERGALVRPEVRRQVEFLQTLRKRASAVAPERRPEEKSRSLVALLATSFRWPWQLAWTPGLAVLLAICLGGLVWFVVQQQQLRNELVGLRARQMEQQNVGSDLRMQVDQLTMRAGQLQAELAREPRPATELPPPGVTSRNQRSALSPPPVFSLVAGTLRSSGSLARIVVPPAATMVRLRLGIPEPAHATFRAVLYDAEAEEILSMSRLRVDTANGENAVVVTLPAEVLSRGDYQIRLSGMTGAEPQPVASYTFRVAAP